jgi:uncharacterized protein YjbK
VSEVELQYVYLGDEQPIVPTSLAGLVLADSDRFTLTDTYFDGEHLELRQAGCSLRVRVSDGDGKPRLTWKGPAQRRRHGKTRPEVEVPIGAVPDEGPALAGVLRRHGLDRLVRRASGVDDAQLLCAIGQLHNERSRHTYVQGLHRLELTWDSLAYPVGPHEVRIEVEVKSKLAERYLRRVDEELRSLFGDDLVRPQRGKVKELCARLYPELVPS